MKPELQDELGFAAASISEANGFWQLMIPNTSIPINAGILIQ